MDMLKLVFGMKNSQFILLLQKDSGRKLKNINNTCFYSTQDSTEMHSLSELADRPLHDCS